MRPFHAFTILVALTGAAASPGQDDGNAGTPHASSTWIEQLRAEDVDARRAAASGIRLADRALQMEALPVLIERLMKEKDGQVRLAVLDTITALGPDAAPAIEALVHTLKTNYGGQGREESHQDYRSALALAAIGKPAVESLRTLCTKGKENVRAEAIMALGRIGPDAVAAVPELLPLLGDASERLREESVHALALIGAPAVDPLLTAASGADSGVRANALHSLGRMAPIDPRAHELIVASARSGEPEARAAAVRSLGRIGLTNDVLLPLLGQNLRHEDERVRLATVTVLSESRALLPAIRSDLEELLVSPNSGVARDAAFALRLSGPDAASTFLRVLQRPESRVDQIAESLAGLGRPVVPSLHEALASRESRVRRGAALALGRLRPSPPEVVSWLSDALDDADVEARADVLHALGSLGSRARDAVPRIRALLLADDASTRALAARVLFECAPRDERLVDGLAGLIEDADPRVQSQAIDMLRALGPLARQAIPIVAGRVGSGGDEVRLAAMAFIGSHGATAAEAVPALSELLNDAKPELQARAIDTLGRLGKAAQPAADGIMRLLHAPDAGVREAAVTTIAAFELDVETIRPHLAGALADDAESVRRAAMRAIQRLGPQASLFVPDIIRTAAKKENAEAAQRALRRFERRGPDPRSVPELVSLLAHEQPPVRLLAVKFLGMAGENANDAIPALERLKDDPAEDVRKAVEEACDRIKTAKPALSG